MAVFEFWKFEFLVFLITFVTVCYVFAKRQYSYWDRRGFKSFPNPNWLFGHFKSAITQQEHISGILQNIYESTAEPILGFYGIFRPMLLVQDPEVVRSILVKDFQHFTDRGVHCNEEYDPLSGHLFALPGQRWKSLRGKLSPTFTSGKLKAMFSTLVDCGANLQSHLDKLADNNELLDVREIAASHATNVIASVAFGIDVDSISDPNNDFRVCGRKIFESSVGNAIRMGLTLIAPKLMSVFKIKVVDESVEKFIKSVVQQNIEHREQKKIVRKDFFQLLIQLRNNGTVQLDDQWETVVKSDEKQKNLSMNEIAAQTFVFFAAGFETSSTTLSFCLYEMAKNNDIQEKVHEEIDRVLTKHNGNITYESVSEMKYLESCIDETLRKYPVLPMLNRTCVKDYRIPGTNQVIPKGVEVFIPCLALQRDEKYYADPEKFDPSRFGEESAKYLIDRPYLPFGDGPRNCIGLRLGKMQTKVGLLMMLQQFKYALRPEDIDSEMEFDPKPALLAPKSVIKLCISKR